MVLQAGHQLQRGQSLTHPNEELGRDHIPEDAGITFVVILLLDSDDEAVEEPNEVEEGDA